MSGGATRARHVAAFVDVPLAHRGLVGDDSASQAAENSLDAFALTAAAGYGCELDVRLAADGIPVVVHDPAVVTPSGRRMRVAHLTAEELGRLGVPSLQQALDVLRGRPVMVEIKQPRPHVGRLEAAVLAIVGHRPAGVIVASFNPWTLVWFARHAPVLPRALIVGPVATRTVLSATVIRWVRPDVLSVALAVVERRRIRVLRRVRPVVCWTVRGAEDLRRALPIVDNVIFEGVIGDSLLLARPVAA
jgi:glycerophosphoryl diester phosphodiesterase